MGTDIGTGERGWFVDDVHIYTCAAGNAKRCGPIAQQTLQQNGKSIGQIDLWSYTIDMQDPSDVLTYTLTSTAPISAGISLDDNRYLNMAPLAGFTGSPTVSLLISDTGNLATTASVRIVVRDDRLVHLPLVLKQERIELPPTVYAVEETDISQVQPTQNFCHDDTMWVGNRYASLLKFNVSDIPARTVIQKAELTLYLWDSFDVPGTLRTVGVYRVNAPWAACNVTWNTQPAVAEEWGRLSIPHAGDLLFTYDVTGLVQGWINGQLPNTGLLLKEVGAANRDPSYRSFLASPITPAPPVLTIHYQNGVVVSQQLAAQTERTEPAAEPNQRDRSLSDPACGSTAEDAAMCHAR
ncbi:MAG: DNRLRE domain-containing protein [Caldilineaceae bacterium]